eukprot:TRINITY_DN661_c0_g1_i2.p1 TRINITY_DN661_c0_g1~~TRINITY_DN661_c0_g1_i2.p1  ORF type:complete len:335 (+),score=57.85 TRINITY_DN661_c0_g1_i2:72-1076(+)
MSHAGAQYTIRVRVIGATSLPKADIGGSSDPYAEVSINQQFIQKTRKIKKTINPTWNQTFDLPVPDPKSAILHVVVKDWDRFSKDDTLGTCSVVVNQLQRNVEKDMWVPLKGKLGQPAGQIHIALTAVNFGSDTASHGPPLSQHSMTSAPTPHLPGYGAPITHHSVQVSHSPMHSVPVSHPSGYGVPGSHPSGYGVPGSHPSGYGVPVTHPSMHGPPLSHPSMHNAPVSHPSMQPAPVANHSNYGAPVSHPSIQGAPVTHPSNYGAPVAAYSISTTTIQSGYPAPQPGGFPVQSHPSYNAGGYPSSQYGGYGQYPPPGQYPSGQYPPGPYPPYQ